MEIRKKSYIKGLALLAVPVLLFVIYFCCAPLFDNISEDLSACVIYQRYGVLCPGCGNTRFVLHSSHGHFLKALRDNITIPAGAGLFLYYYIKWALGFFGIKTRDIIKREVVCLAVFALLIVYYILRNYLPILAPA